MYLIEFLSTLSNASISLVNTAEASSNLAIHHNRPNEKLLGQRRRAGLMHEL